MYMYCIECKLKNKHAWGQAWEQGYSSSTSNSVHPVSFEYKAGCVYSQTDCVTFLACYHLICVLTSQ